MDLNDLLFRHQLAAMRKAGQIKYHAPNDDDIGVLCAHIEKRLENHGGGMRAPVCPEAVAA